MKLLSSIRLIYRIGFLSAVAGLILSCSTSALDYPNDGDIDRSVETDDGDAISYEAPDDDDSGEISSEQNQENSECDPDNAEEVDGDRDLDRIDGDVDDSEEFENDDLDEAAESPDEEIDDDLDGDSDDDNEMDQSEDNNDDDNNEIADEGDNQESEPDSPPLYPCSTNGRCPADAPICYQGLCVQCRSADDCPSSLSCINSHCVRGCQRNEDCCSPQAANEELCTEKPYCHLATARCSKCRNDDDCGEGEACKVGSCLAEKCIVSLCLDYTTYIWCENEEWTSYSTCSQFPRSHCWLTLGTLDQPCQPAVCEPFSYQCVGATLRQCTYDGQRWDNILSCSGTVCNDDYGRCVDLDAN